MLDFSLGNLVIKDTPRFEKIISEAASSLATTDILVCKTIARAGVRGNAEMVDYFTREIHFLAGHPSTSEQLRMATDESFSQSRTARAVNSTRVFRNSLRKILQAISGRTGETARIFCSDLA